MPVLSRTTLSTLPRASSASADLMSIPFSAALPVPAIIATGVARPKAQGHEITRTVTAKDRAVSKSLPTKSQIKNVTAEIIITAGTKIPLTLSASLAIGAFEEPASSTR